MTDGDTDSVPALGVRLRAAITDSLRYWEPRRVVFNGVLTVTVIVYFIINWPHSWGMVSFESVLGLFLLIVLANICYCAAYLADVFVQMSGFREVWLKVRWGLFATGVSFAGIITRWLAMGFFGAHGVQ
jgi:hypothetical protein